MSFDNVLFTNYQPVDAELVFDNIIDEFYKVEGPLGHWDYSYVLKIIDPTEYNIMKNEFINDNYIEYKGECWTLEDYTEAREIVENEEDDED